MRSSHDRRRNGVHTVLEGRFAEFSSFLLELFDGTLIDTTALVDQVTGGGGLAGIDVSDNCEINRWRSDRKTRGVKIC